MYRVSIEYACFACLQKSQIIKWGYVLPVSTAQVWKNTFALSIGTIGYGLAVGIGFPAPSLTGPTLFVSLASIAGARIDIHPWLRNGAFLLIGIAMGSEVTPQVLVAARQWPISLVILAGTLVAIFFICRTVLELGWKLDRQTSTLSSTPGHLSYVLGLSVHTKGDLPTISVIQSMRVLFLTLIVPLVVTLLGYRASETEISGVDMTSWSLAIIILVSLVCATIFNWIKLAASFLIAGMAISSLAHITSWAEGGLPAYLWLPAIVTLGCIIGTRFSNVSWATLRKAATAGLAVTLIAMACSAIAAFLFSKASGLPFSQLLIAFAPGGVEAMAAMAIILNADPTFVAAHHLWRLLVLTVLAPFMLAKADENKTNR